MSGIIQAALFCPAVNLISRLGHHLIRKRLKLREITLNEVITVVRQGVAMERGVDEEDIKVDGETHLQKDLDLDSLASIELTMTLEREFRVSIADGALEKTETVSDIFDYLLTADRT